MLTNKQKELSQDHRIWWLASFVVLLIAFHLRISGLSNRPLWFDESIEYWMAVVKWPLIAQSVAQATHDPPLYSYLLHGWMRGGIDEFWLRLPSFWASLLSIAGVIYLGRTLVGRAVGLIAGLILAVSAADVRYAQEVGQYALIVCLTTWNLIFLYKAVSQRKWLWWSLWGLTALLNIYSHYGATIVILATASTILLYHVWHREWQQVWRHIFTGTTVVILVLPLLLFIIPQQMGRLGATTQPIALSNLWQTSWLMIVFHLAGNPGIMDWPWPNIAQWWVALPVGVAILAAITQIKKPASPVVLLLVTWLTYYLVSRTGAYFFSPSRHSLMLSPLIVLTIAVGVTAVSKRSRLAGLFLLLLILPVSLLIPAERAEDLRAVTQYWQTSREDNDVTYVYYGAVPGFSYQLNVQNGTPADLPMNWYNQCYIGNPEPFCHADNVFYGKWTRNLSANEQRAAFDSIVGDPPDRFWIIFSHVHEPDRLQLLEGFAPDYRLINDHQEENASALLLEKR